MFFYRFSSLLIILTAISFSAMRQNFIFDIVGAIVFQKTINDFQTTIDLSVLPKGNYVCTFISENKKHFKKIVIQ